MIEREDYKEAVLVVENLLDYLCTHNYNDILDEEDNLEELSVFNENIPETDSEVPEYINKADQMIKHWLPQVSGLECVQKFLIISPPILKEFEKIKEFEENLIKDYSNENKYTRYDGSDEDTLHDDFEQEVLDYSEPLEDWGNFASTTCALVADVLIIWREDQDDFVSIQKYTYSADKIDCESNMFCSENEYFDALRDLDQLSALEPQNGIDIQKYLDSLTVSTEIDYIEAPTDLDLDKFADWTTLNYWDAREEAMLLEIEEQFLSRIENPSRRVLNRLHFLCFDKYWGNKLKIHL